MQENILQKEGINPTTLGLLSFINLNTSGDEYITNIIRTYLYEYQTDSGKYPHEILDEAGYIKYIKGKPKDDLWKKVRLSDKGEKILKEMNRKPLNELAEFMMDYTKKEYQRIGVDKRYIQGGDKLLFYISEFLENRPSEYTEHMIRAVIDAYISKFEYGDHKYLNKISTLFYKPSNVYSTKYLNEDSPLHNFIISNQDLIKYHYKLIK